MIHIQNVESISSYSALKIPDIKITPGNITALLGPNGSGKSTLLESIVGLKNPVSSGVFLIEDQNASDWLKSKNNRLRLGVLLSQTTYPQQTKVKELIKFHKYLFKKQSINLLEKLHLHPLRFKYYHQHSLSEKQRLNIFMSLSHHPDII